MTILESWEPLFTHSFEKPFGRHRRFSKPNAALPVLTLRPRGHRPSEWRRCPVMHLENGHTDGDSVIFFPRSNVVHMGDDFLRIGFPLSTCRAAAACVV